MDLLSGLQCINDAGDCGTVIAGVKVLHRAEDGRVWRASSRYCLRGVVGGGMCHRDENHFGDHRAWTNDVSIGRNLSTPDSRAFWGESKPGDVVSSAYQGVPDEQMAVRDLTAERHRDLALWAAAVCTVLVCLGQLAAERAPPSREIWYKNLEVD